MKSVWIVFAAVAALAVLWGAWRTWRTRCVMNRLEKMLEAAVQGHFIEERFDESRASRVETRLARYLAGAGVYAGNVAAGKAKLESLVADISHQTKTPLANILLYTQLLAEQELTPEGRRQVAALAEQTRKLHSLIEALVKTSRLETGILALHPKAGPLLPVLEGAAAQLAAKAAAKNISLKLPEPTGYEDCTAVFDPKWTAEAVCNLLDNAVKYTPEGGCVELRLVAYELFCRIDVVDDGPDVPEAEQAKIFQRFYRSAAALEAEGVGLGLYLARRIAEGQGGYVKVTSAPGRGAEFSLYLPRG